MRRDFCLKRLVARCTKSYDGWRDVLVEDRRTTPAETAACRLDFEAWLRSLPRRKRRIAELLSQRRSTSETAKRFHVSPGRISQLRRELHGSWLAFHSDPTEREDEAA